MIRKFHIILNGERLVVVWLSTNGGVGDRLGWLVILIENMGIFILKIILVSVK